MIFGTGTLSGIIEPHLEVYGTYISTVTSTFIGMISKHKSSYLIKNNNPTYYVP